MNSTVQMSPAADSLHHGLLHHSAPGRRLGILLLRGEGGEDYLARSSARAPVRMFFIA